MAEPAYTALYEAARWTIAVLGETDPEDYVEKIQDDPEKLTLCIQLAREAVALADSATPVTAVGHK